MQENTDTLVTRTWIVVMLTLTVLIAYNLRWQAEVISSDGKGYYAYLPWFFLDQEIDPSASFVNEIDDKFIIKYYSGTAVLMAPFFGLAHVVATVGGFPTNGYSEPYQLFVGIAAIFYAFIGIWACIGLLKTYGVKNANRLAAVTFFYFGTNLFYYTVIDSSFSHIYSFALMSCFLLSTKNLLTRNRPIFLFISAVLLALIVIVRPTGLLITSAIPFLVSSRQELKQLTGLIARQWALIPALLLFLVIVGIQPALWYLQSGEWLFRSYRNEGFYFLHPHLLDILFSFRKGLFIYTPIAFIAGVAAIYVFRNDKYRLICWLSFFLLITYVMASWWNWYYGDSFGLRAYIDFYSMLVIPLGILFGKTAHRFALFGICFLLLSLNLIQSYQYFSGIIAPSNMDMNKYRYVFPKVGEEYKNSLGGMRDIANYSDEPLEKVYSTFNDFEGKYAYWENNQLAEESENGNHYDLLNGNDFGTICRLPTQLFEQSRNLYVKVWLKRLEFTERSSSGALFTVSVVNKNDGYHEHYSAFPINEYPDASPGKWRTMHYTFNIPVVPEKGHEIRLVIWNKELQNFAADDFRVEFYRIH